MAQRCRGLIPARYLALVLLLNLPCIQLPAEELSRVRLAQLEAAYLVNFARYTDWAAGVFAKANSPSLILVHADTHLVSAMGEVAERCAPIAGHRIKVRGTRASSARTPLATQTARCHVLFLDGALVDSIGELLHAANAHPVLTVSNISGFAPAGGMFELAQNGPRVLFDVNPTAIRAARLNVSPRVLRMARRLSVDT